MELLVNIAATISLVLIVACITVSLYQLYTDIDYENEEEED